MAILEIHIEDQHGNKIGALSQENAKVLSNGGRHKFDLTKTHTR